MKFEVRRNVHTIENFWIYNRCPIKAMQAAKITTLKIIHDNNHLYTKYKTRKWLEFLKLEILSSSLTTVVKLEAKQSSAQPSNNSLTSWGFDKCASSCFSFIFHQTVFLHAAKPYWGVHFHINNFLEHHI